MPRTKTIGSLIATILVGALTFFLATPKMIGKIKTKSSKASVDQSIEESDDLFI
ncbi:MAG: hypothetical protein JXR03_10775 [Cyclobacteriaceae bacterium]